MEKPLGMFKNVVCWVLIGQMGAQNNEGWGSVISKAMSHFKVIMLVTSLTEGLLP